MLRDRLIRRLRPVRRAVLARAAEADDRTLEQLDEYYRPENYGQGLYR